MVCPHMTLPRPYMKKLNSSSVVACRADTDDMYEVTEGLDLL